MNKFVQVVGIRQLSVKTFNVRKQLGQYHHIAAADVRVHDNLRSQQAVDSLARRVGRESEGGKGITNSRRYATLVGDKQCLFFYLAAVVRPMRRNICPPFGDIQLVVVIEQRLEVPPLPSFMIEDSIKGKESSVNMIHAFSRQKKVA